MFPRPDTESALSLTGIVVSLVVSAVALSATAEQYGSLSPRFLLVTLLLILQLTAFVLVTSGQAPSASARAPILLWLQALFISVLYFLVESPLTAILGIIWVVQAVEILPRRSNLLTGAAIVMFAVAQMLVSPAPLIDVVPNIITLGLFHVFALITTRRFDVERQLREETADLNRRLVATRELLADHSRQEERLRIARDLHDSLGHHMTALILQLEVTTHHATGPAREQTQQSREMAKQLLRELRSAVSELREEDPIRLGPAIERLARNMPSLTVQVEISTQDNRHRPATTETLLRCVQEALTNIARHSSADRASVRLETDNEQLILRIHDNGGPASGIREGHGLSGMRERLSALNGSMDWFTDQQGFTLTVRVPDTGQTP